MDKLGSINYKDLLLNYDLGTISHVRPLGGFTAKNYYIKDAYRQYVLKVYPLNQAKSIQKSAMISRIAAESGLPVPFPFSNRENSFLTIKKNEGICAVLLPYLPGSILHNEHINSLQYQSVACLAVRFQNILSTLALDLANQNEFLKTFIREYENKKNSFFNKLYSLCLDEKKMDLILSFFAVKEEIISLTKSILSNPSRRLCTVVHGDFHNENVIFKGGKAKWIIDLDDVRFGWSGEDVVTFAIFSGGGGCFTLSGITHAKPLFEYFIKYSKATREEMSLSIDATLLRLALSFRLEEWVLKDSSSQAINLINRDLIKYRLFISNYDAIHEAWACV